VAPASAFLIGSQGRRPPQPSNSDVTTRELGQVTEFKGRLRIASFSLK
jgi:hypothetical protein